jgi:hypothetical protein
MKIRIPKELAGVIYPKALMIELNGFNIDLFLSTLYFKILSGGRPRGRRLNDPTKIDHYIESLAQHPDLEGFDDPEGKRILSRLTHTSLIITGFKGRTKQIKQILALAPYSLLCHKADFPTESSRQRNVDTFIYQALRNKVGSDDGLRDFLKEYLGKGVELNNAPYLGGKYDGTTELDTMTRLSIALIDLFQTSQIGLTKQERNIINPCLGLVDQLASDLYRYLFSYTERMPMEALTYNLKALINFELFIYTLKVIYGINQLVKQPDQLPAAMQDRFTASAPEIYIDFTAQKGSLSQQMAINSVRDHIEAYQLFLRSLLTLRQLDSYAEILKRNTRYKREIELALDGQISGASYLQGLLSLIEHPSLGIRIDALAQLDEEKIREANYGDDDESREQVDQWFETLLGGAENDFDRLITLLVAGQQTATTTSMMKWFVGVGGLHKPFGLLRGDTRSRLSWRYEASNDLLGVLVQLASARMAPQRQGDNPIELPAIRLSDFLHFLEERFGILVDRPPSQFQGADHTAAARDNLRAMLARLRQMGIFTDLSDDFTVQRLHPPYADSFQTNEVA